MKNFIFLFLLVFCLTACGSSPQFQGYVAADLQTYEAVAAEYLLLVEAAKDTSGQPKFSDEERQRRKNLVESWKLRIDSTKEK